MWGCPRTILPDKEFLLCSKLSPVAYKFLGELKLATSSYHPKGNVGVERVNYTMAYILAMVVNERQADWDLQLPHDNRKNKI